MNIIVPFTKEVKFDQTLGDVLSISLEHEFNFSNNILLGNFVVSGTYKTHELSANKLDFSHTLPFELSIREDIDESTLNFSIDNFTYEVLEGDILKVDIDYLVKAKELVREDIIFDEATIDDLFSNEEELLDLANDEPITKEVLEEPLEETVNTEDRAVIDENTILNFASENAESFVSYIVHTVKEGENIETICKLYSKNENDLIDYNIGIPFNPGDKILVPEDDE